MMRKTLVISTTTVVVAVSALIGAVAAPASASSASYGPATSYVALGDSYSAGLGAAGDTDTTCGRSPSGYPTLWAQAHGISDFVNASCSGAVAGDLLASQISSLSADTDVVTLTIGGNDVGLGNQAATCLLWGDISCRNAVNDAAAAFPTTLATVDQAFAAIRAASPHAVVYVLGYPRLFETSPVCFTPLVPSPTSRALLNTSVDNLNAALAAKAAAAGFVYADATAAFSGHGVCASSPWINGVASLPGPLHPNTTGYKSGYLAALTAVTG